MSGQSLSWTVTRSVRRPASMRGVGGGGRLRRCVRRNAQFWGKPRLMPPWLGSSQRDVIAFSRVKKWKP